MEKKYTLLNCDFDKKSYQKLNSQFAKVKIRIAYDGLNRNGSIIPKDVLEKMSKTSLFNIPIVGEYSEEKKNFLGHGGKLEISDDGFKFIDTTRPYGVVPSDTEVYWETVRDKNGYDEHEYLCCTGILWHSRYPETEKILDDGANHSMELEILDGEYTEDYKFLIKDAEFSALCILGRDEYHAKDDPDSTNVEPCFEDSCITRYTAKDFKSEFSLMLEEYKKFNLSKDNLNIDTIVNKEEIFLDKTKIYTKIKSVLSELKYRTNTDKHYNKYECLSVVDNAVNVVDRECEYKVYSIPFEVTETSEDMIVNLDYDNKQEKSFIVGDKVDVEFNIQDEVKMIASDTATFQVSEYQSSTIKELSENLEIMTSNYNNAEAEIKRLKSQLELFESEKKEILANKHKESINTLIDSKREEMGKYSEFLDYCINPDYAKSVEQVSNELKEIHYNFLNKNKSGKHSFSAIETKPVVSSYEKDAVAERYGSDVAKYFNR